jgi:hypothetical protein
LLGVVGDKCLLDLFLLLFLLGHSFLLIFLFLLNNTLLFLLFTFLLLLLGLFEGLIVKPILVIVLFLLNQFVDAEHAFVELGFGP